MKEKEEKEFIPFSEKVQNIPWKRIGAILAIVGVLLINAWIAGFFSRAVKKPQALKTFTIKGNILNKHEPKVPIKDAMVKLFLSNHKEGALSFAADTTGYFHITLDSTSLSKFSSPPDSIIITADNFAPKGCVVKNGDGNILVYLDSLVVKMGFIKEETVKIGSN